MHGQLIAAEVCRASLRTSNSKGTRTNCCWVLEGKYSTNCPGPRRSRPPLKSTPWRSAWLPVIRLVWLGQVVDGSETPHPALGRDPHPPSPGQDHGHGRLGIVEQVGGESIDQDHHDMPPVFPAHTGQAVSKSKANARSFGIARINYPRRTRTTFRLFQVERGLVGLIHDDFGLQARRFGIGIFAAQIRVALAGRLRGVEEVPLGTRRDARDPDLVSARGHALGAGNAMSRKLPSVSIRPVARERPASGSAFGAEVPSPSSSKTTEPPGTGLPL